METTNVEKMDRPCILSIRIFTPAALYWSV